MIDVNPTSDRWKEICKITDENSQNRALRKYVYELEHRVHAHETVVSLECKKRISLRR